MTGPSNVKPAAPWMVAVLALLAAVPLHAQPQSGGASSHGSAADAPTADGAIRGELIQDIETVEEKFLGLAEALRGHYGWRPAEGVRSVSEVFGHVAAANLLYPTFYGVQPPAAYRGESRNETMRTAGALEQLTDPDELTDAMERSFAHARRAVEELPPERLEEAVETFEGRSTVRGLLIQMTTHMHEHLGQMIAYARSNGVVPPWSAGDGG